MERNECSWNWPKNGEKQAWEPLNWVINWLICTFLCLFHWELNKNLENLGGNWKIEKNLEKLGKSKIGKNKAWKM